MSTDTEDIFGDGPSSPAIQRLAEIHASNSPQEILERSRVDLISIIEHGIPDREYVPGAQGILPKAKRIHIAAAAKSGKSIAFATVTAVRIVQAGGTVVELDRENGEDESARRLQTVLEAFGDSDPLRQQVRERFHYHAWPALRLDWSAEDYLQAFTGADIVIFDSSRSHTAPFGLKENDSDDWATFTTALIDPLMQAGISTMTLDNMGHEAKDRPRGTTSKVDLSDLIYTMKANRPFSLAAKGLVEIQCTESRIGEITTGDTWQMELGAGHYGNWQKIGAKPPEARDDIREAAIEVLTAAGQAMGHARIAKAIRARPHNKLKFDDKYLRDGLQAWAADPTSGVLPGPNEKGFTTSQITESSHGGTVHHNPHGETLPPRSTTAPATTPKTPTNTSKTPRVDAPTLTHHGDQGGEGDPLRGTTPTTPGPKNHHNDGPETVIP